MAYPKLIENLIEQLIKFPGVGRRSAERMVFYILNGPKEYAKELADCVLKLKERLKFCRLCNNLTENEVCAICQDPGRDRSLICVIENPKDLLAIERTGTFKGLYFCLLGAIAPTEGRGPDDINLKSLIQRIQEEKIKEIVIATDPDTEGEMTALYLTKELKPFGVKITRIGLGIPVGSAVEYADLSTLTMSLTSRREL